PEGRRAPTCHEADANRRRERLRGPHHGGGSPATQGCGGVPSGPAGPEHDRRARQRHTEEAREFTGGVSKRMLTHETFFHVSGATNPSDDTPTDREVFGRQGSLRQRLRKRS
ncbi:hypothetical protein THAOC_21894, partial [Thalassiosira oceanica]